MAQNDIQRPFVRIRPSRGWSALRLGELWEFRDVLVMLALRDVKLRYKQTALGIVWVILQPLAAGLVLALIFGRFAGMPSGGRPYVLFIFAGLLGWNLFAGILQRAGNSLVAEARLITKVYFPRLLIPCAAAAAALVDFLISLVVMVGLLVWYGVWPGWWLLLLPVVVLINVGLAVGISFWISALNVRYRDFMYALPFMIQMGLYASPVVYGLELVPERWRAVFALNPMAGVLEGLRSALLGGTAEVFRPLALAAVMALIALVSGAFFFRRVERDFTDNL
ncbi:MAG: ABC transporter permease [Opitutaceae bacterium]|jgi:lipopolysaccharide transport system permease protein